jgi:hypothetical protein
MKEAEKSTSGFRAVHNRADDRPLFVGRIKAEASVVDRVERNFTWERVFTTAKIKFVSFLRLFSYDYWAWNTQ